MISHVELCCEIKCAYRRLYFSPITSVKFITEQELAASLTSNNEHLLFLWHHDILIQMDFLAKPLQLGFLSAPLFMSFPDRQLP